MSGTGAGTAAETAALAAIAVGFALGAIVIILAGRFARTRAKAPELWAIYRSEFLIVAALLVPAFLGPFAFAAFLLALFARGGFEIAGVLEIPPLSPAKGWAAGSAILVLAAAAVSAAMLRNGAGGLAWIFAVYVSVELGDSFALIAGKLFGRTPIFTRVSPAKTLEGLAAGLIGGAVAGLILGQVLLGLPAASAAAFAASVIAAGLAGDLSASALKRWRGRKDFSPLSGLHGGALDIYDSFLFAAPAALIFRVFATGTG